MDVEAGLFVVPGLDQSGRHHQAVGRERGRKDVEDVLAALQEALAGRGRDGRHVQVEHPAVLGLEGQRRAVGPGDDAVAVEDPGGPAEALAEGGRVELVHRRVDAAVPLLGRQAQLLHGNPATGVHQEMLDVAGEAAADGEHRLARPDAERGLDLGPHLAGEAARDIGPAGDVAATLVLAGLAVAEQLPALHCARCSTSRAMNAAPRSTCETSRYSSGWCACSIEPGPQITVE